MTGSGRDYTKRDHVEQVVNAFFELIGDLNYDSNGVELNPLTDQLVIPAMISGVDPDFLLHTTKTPHFNPLLLVTMKEFADENERLSTIPNFKGQIGKQADGGSFYVANSTSIGDWSWLSYGSFTPGEFDIFTKHYHWDHKKALGEEYGHYIILGNASRASTWDYIVNQALQNLNSREGEGPGIVSKWGAEYVVSGTLEFSDGTYYFDSPLKLIPLCTLKGSGSSGCHDRDSVVLAPSANWDGSLYLIDGAYRNGTNSNSNFHTNLQGFHLKCGGVVDRGVYISISQSSAISDIDVEAAVTCGFYVSPNCDDFTVDRCTIQNLTGDRTKYGWWFEDGVKSVSMRQLTTDYCDVGLSFGAVEAIDIAGFECEKCILPIEIREKNHDEIDGTAGDKLGNPGGISITGIRALRDDTVSTSRALARVRYNETGGGELLKGNLILEGWADGNGSDLPYDRVEVQANSGTIYEYPLRWDLGFDRTTAIFDFRFDLMKMIMNKRFRSDKTQMIGTRLCASTNPSTFVSNNFALVALEPGLYWIEIPDGNNYDTGSISVYKQIAGSTVEGMANVNAAVSRYYNHPGGSMYVQVTGVTGVASIDIYFRPWFL